MKLSNVNRIFKGFYSQEINVQQNSTHFWNTRRRRSIWSADLQGWLKCTAAAAVAVETHQHLTHMEEECHDNENWYQVQRNNRISRSLFLDRISCKWINSAFVYGYRLRGLKNTKFFTWQTRQAHVAQDSKGRLGHTFIYREPHVQDVSQRLRVYVTWVFTLTNSVGFKQ